jgi:hypothetical protein
VSRTSSVLLLLPVHSLQVLPVHSLQVLQVRIRV